MNKLIQHDANVDKFLSGSDLGEVIKVKIKQILRYKTNSSRRNSN